MNSEKAKAIYEAQNRILNITEPTYRTMDLPQLFIDCQWIHISYKVNGKYITGIFSPVAPYHFAIIALKARYEIT